MTAAAARVVAFATTAAESSAHDGLCDLRRFGGQEEAMEQDQQHQAQGDHPGGKGVRAAVHTAMRRHHHDH